MPIYGKHFTVAEANALLPEVRRVLAELHAMQPALYEAFLATAQRASGNGHRSSTAPYRQGHQRAATLIRGLTDRGIILRDVETGLIDFPHWRNGREVFLCWESADDRVRYWHDVEEGYAGRQPL